MSGIGGIYNVDGAPIDEELLQRMRDIIDYRGPDGSGFWINRNVGFVHRLLWNTEESIYEKQPLTNGKGLWVTSDCRIDNRDELKREFQSRGIWNAIGERLGLTSPPDAAYLLLAYELWEEEAPKHLLGDFAFAIWDERRRKLFCARDQIGIKPFVYHWNGKKFIFGSEMKQIFQDLSVSRELNRAHLAEFLLKVQSNRWESPYAAIQRLPSAHSLLIENGRLSIKKYWDWNPDSEPLSKDSITENAARFRHLFEEALRARLRVPPGYRSGSHLSGGLDSSSIVAVSASLQSESSFPIFSLRFTEADSIYKMQNPSHPHDGPDEIYYFQTLVERYGLEAHTPEIKGWGPLENFEENCWFQEIPPVSPNMGYFAPNFKTVREARVRVLFDGTAGDDLFWIGSRCFLREFQRGRFIKFLKQWLGLCERQGISYRYVLNSIGRSLIPEWVKIPYRRYLKNYIPHWIDPAFATEIGLRERTSKDFLNDPSFHTSSSYGILNSIRSAANVPLALETLEKTSASCQIDLRSPYHDLRLMRFCATLPWDQKFREGVTKVLLREAMKDLLPVRFLTRYRRSNTCHLDRIGLEKYALKEAKETFENPHAALRLITVQKNVKNLFDHYFLEKQPYRYVKFFFPIWFLVSLDQWLKNQENFKKRLKEVSREEQKKVLLATKER